MVLLLLVALLIRELSALLDNVLQLVAECIVVGVAVADAAG